jgi:hypothetical protein
MTVAPNKQAQQVRQAIWGAELVSLAQIPPTGSTTLWTVSGGSIAITAVSVVIVTAMSATATTLNIGCNVAGSASATALMNAGTLTSLTAGARVAGVPALTAVVPVLTGDVVATAGPVTWIASAGQTGTCLVTLNYIPLNAGATIG